MKNLMWMSLLLYAGVVNAVGNCNVGSNPWLKGRQVDRNVEVEYVLTKQLVVESLNSQGKPSVPCTLAVGEHIVVPLSFDTSVQHPFATREEKMKLAWVKRCGNPIVSRFYFVVPQKAEAVPVVVAKTEPKPLLDGTDTEYGKTKTVFIPNQPDPVVEEEPRETRVVRYVMVAPRRQYYGSGYSYGTPAFIPSPQYVRSDYYMSPNIRYPEPPPYVPPPQHVTGPSFVTGPVTSGPGFITGPVTPGPGFATGGATSGPTFATH